MTVNEALRQMKQLEKQATRLGYDSAQRIAAEGLKRAQVLSSGPYKQAALTQMGHPYAVRHGRGVRVVVMLPPEVINIQNGGFLRAWKTKIAKTAGGYVVHVINESTAAEWLRAGTSKMVARPLDKELSTQMGPVRDKELKALSERLKP